MPRLSADFPGEKEVDVPAGLEPAFLVSSRFPVPSSTSSSANPTQQRSKGATKPAPGDSINLFDKFSLSLFTSSFILIWSSFVRMMIFLRLLLLTFVPILVLGQCPYQGWSVSGGCQITGYCMDPREQCYYSSVCCRISSQQPAQTTKQNPKTGAMETNFCPLGSYRDGGCSSWCWTPSQVCVNRQDCCIKTNIPVNNNNNNNINPSNPGTNPIYPGPNPPYNSGGPYNPPGGMSGSGNCVQGRCPLTMCQDGTCSLTGFCYDQNNNCYNGVCCGSKPNPYTNNGNNINNNNPSPYYPPNPYSNNPSPYYPPNPYSNNPNSYPTNGYGRPDPTIIVINANPAAGIPNNNPAYPYNSNSVNNGYSPSNNYNNGYNPSTNGYSPYNNGYNPTGNGYNPNNNGYNPYNNINSNGYNPYNNYNNYFDCTTAPMVPDQSACNSLQGQCSNPMVAQTCRQMCCGGAQFAGVGSALPQLSGR